MLAVRKLQPKMTISFPASNRPKMMLPKSTPAIEKSR